MEEEEEEERKRREEEKKEKMNRGRERKWRRKGDHFFSHIEILESQ